MKTILDKLWINAGECEKVKADMKQSKHHNILVGKQCRIIRNKKAIAVLCVYQNGRTLFYDPIGRSISDISEIEYFDDSPEAINAALLEVRREAFEAGKASWDAEINFDNEVEYTEYYSWTEWLNKKQKNNL